MKKYYCEATKKQWEKPTEPKQFLCATAKTWVIADSEEEAIKLATAKLDDKYHGSGSILGEARITKVTDLPVDWNYGYGDGRKSGNADDKSALREECTKK